MSANIPGNDTPTTGGTTGTGGTGGAGGASGANPSLGAARGATDEGTTRDTSTSLTTGTGGGGTGSTGAGGGAATGTATATAPSGIAGQAQEYGRRAAEMATQARDYVGDKLSNLREVDYGQVAENAKEYARQKPGQALLISAAAGFVIGLLLRGSRR
ncbi:MAG TPA: hypothetical protein VGV59_04770 [Pyrinomonadaceae bacterium]|nr:hypothetical protein [Pyrinomonadaceae bacterium]